MANGKQDTKGLSTGAKAGMGMGLAALAAAAAGAYYFYGTKNASKNRKALRGWVVKAKGEVLERMEKLKDVSEDSYNTVVEQVMDKYKKAKNIDPAELAVLAADMRGMWKRINREIRGTQTAQAKRTPARKPARAKTPAKAKAK